MLKRFLDWLLGEKCKNGTRGCWGRCRPCFLERVEGDRQGARDWTWFD